MTNVHSAAFSQMVREEFIRCLSPSEILPSLIRNGLISEVDSQLVLKEVRRQDKALLLWTILDRKLIEESKKRLFAEILWTHNYTHLAVSFYPLLHPLPLSIEDRSIAALRMFYEQNYARVPVLPWDEEDLSDLESIWHEIDCRLLQKSHTGVLIDDGIAVRYRNILEQLSSFASHPRLLTITGEPGVGKSTLIKKIGLDWARQKELTSIKALFIIQLADVQEPVATILDNAWLQFRDCWSMIDEEGVKSWLAEFNARPRMDILVLLDGYDEYIAGTCKQLDSVIQNRSHLTFNLVITTREYRAKEIKRCDLYAKVVGFTPETVGKYIANFRFSNTNSALLKADLMKYLYNEATLNSGVASIAKLPLMLTFFCIVSDLQNGQLPKNVWELYRGIYDCMVSKYIEHYKVKSDRKQVIEQHKLSITHASRLAYYKLMKPNYSSQGSILSEFPDDIPFRIGLISIRKVQVLFEKQETVTFPHKTLHEFLAALYFVTLEERMSEHAIFYEQLDSGGSLEEAVQKFEYFMYFIAGWSHTAGRVLYDKKLLPYAKTLSDKLMKQNASAGTLAQMTTLYNTFMQTYTKILPDIVLSGKSLPSNYVQSLQTAQNAQNLWVLHFYYYPTLKLKFPNHKFVSEHISSSIIVDYMQQRDDELEDSDGYVPVENIICLKMEENISKEDMDEVEEILVQAEKLHAIVVACSLTDILLDTLKLCVSNDEERHMEYATLNLTRINEASVVEVTHHLLKMSHLKYLDLNVDQLHPYIWNHLQKVLDLINHQLIALRIKASQKLDTHNFIQPSFCKVKKTTLLQFCSFENCGLTTYELSSILPMFHGNTCLNTLFLKGNVLSGSYEAASSNSLIPLMKQCLSDATANLQLLDLSDCKLSCSDIVIVLQWVAESLKALDKLELSSNPNLGDVPEALLRLCYHPTLKLISLLSCNLGDTACDSLLEIVEKLPGKWKKGNFMLKVAGNSFSHTKLAQLCKSFDTEEGGKFIIINESDHKELISALTFKDSVLPLDLSIV